MAAIGTRLLTITVGGTQYKAEVTKAVWTSAVADSDTTTFADAAAGGGRAYKLNLEFVQDAATGSLWTKVFSDAGTTAAVLVAPYGNTTASATQPHFSATVTISEPDGDFLGGEADSSTTARFKTEVEWESTRPVKVTS